MIIKVCGMRDAENIRAVEALGIDVMGFIFWKPSSRYVGAKPAYLPEHCRRAGVFVDASVEDILAAVEDFRLDVLQLHGHETPDAIAALRERVPGIDIAKSLAIAGPADLEQAAVYESVCEGVGPGDERRIREFNVPGCIGIDLNSRFETAPGLKDVHSLKTFIETIRP